MDGSESEAAQSATDGQHVRRRGGTALREDAKQFWSERAHRGVTSTRSDVDRRECRQDVRPPRIHSDGERARRK